MPRTTATESYLMHSVQSAELGYHREVDSYQEALMRRQPKTQEAKDKMEPSIQQARNDIVPQEQRIATNAPIETGKALADYHAKNAQKEQQLQQAVAKNPDLFSEIDRRRNGMSILNDLGPRQGSGSNGATANFAQGRSQMRREEEQWRSEGHDEGVLGPLRAFAANKWHALTHGESDTTQSQRSSFGRDRQMESWARGSVPLEEDTTQQTITKIEPEPVQQADRGWRSFFGFSRSGELHHMAPEWSGKENTRLIDTMSDDEISMMGM